MGFKEKIAQEKHLLAYPETPHGPLGMIYPNVYGVGMACLGFQQIYRLFQEAGIAAERIFFDKKGRETRSLNNQIPLFRFPYLAASYTYELDIIHLLQMMIRGGVEPLWENRSEGSPILIVGGQASTANVRVVSRIADIVVIGEGERVVTQLAQTLIQAQGLPRMDVLTRVAEHVPNVFVPAVHETYDPNVHTAHSMDEIDAVDCHSIMLAPDDEFGGAFLLEVSRGCMYRCKFCIVHYMNGSARYRNYDNLLSVLERYQNDYHKVGLLGAAVADHPQVEEITEWLLTHGKQVSTSSLRAERITERFLDLLKDAGQHNITVAPETGGIESRKRMRKGVKDEKYIRLAKWAGQRRFPSMKLYFVIGTPESEPMEEANEIIEFGKKMNDAFTKSGGGRMTITVSPFVPKPTTPWADGALWEPKIVKKASRIIRKELAFRNNVRVPPVNVKEARAETVLSWAGAELTDELLRLAQGELSLENAFKEFDFSSLDRNTETSALPHASTLKYLAKVRD